MYHMHHKGQNKMSARIDYPYKEIAENINEYK